MEIPQARFRLLTAATLSAAVHGLAFWAAGLVPYGPILTPDLHPAMDLLSIVEVEEPEPLAIASQPGVAPGNKDAEDDEAPSEGNERSESTEAAPVIADPKPEPIAPTPKARGDAPAADPAAEPIPPTGERPTLPGSVHAMPSVPIAGLIRLPQGPASRSRARTDPSKASPTRRSAGRTKGGRVDERNPVLMTALDRILRRQYPNDAREAGIEGYAKLDLVVTRWGRPESIRVVESHGHPGFGEACVRAVKHSRWRPAKNPAGRRIAMRVRYRCRFTVDP